MDRFYIIFKQRDINSIYWIIKKFQVYNIIITKLSIIIIIIIAGQIQFK